MSVTWRQGYARRELVKSESNVFEHPYWALAPPKELSNFRIDVCEPDSSVSQSAHPYAALAGDRVLTIGRNKFENASALILPAGTDNVSRIHVVIIFTRQGVMVFDYHSRHGCQINGQPMTPGIGEPFFDGDVLTFGAAAPPGASRTLVFSGMGVTRAQGEAHYLREAVQAAAQAQAQAAQPAATQMVRARHILLKHTGSRNPICWKSPHPVTRSPAEALAGIVELRRRIVEDNESFEYLASIESECGSHQRGGDLGPFSYEEMQEPFSAATFALNIGDISEPVQTGSGTHIIQRTA